MKRVDVANAQAFFTGCSEAILRANTLKVASEKSITNSGRLE